MNFKSSLLDSTLFSVAKMDEVTLKWSRYKTKDSPFASMELKVGLDRQDLKAKDNYILTVFTILSVMLVQIFCQFCCLLFILFMWILTCRHF